MDLIRHQGPQTLQKSSKQPLTTLIELRLPVQQPDGSVKTEVLQVDNSVRVHENEDFAMAILYLIATSNGKDSLSDAETWLFLESCRNNDVRPKELYDAFWLAQGDEFVGKEGIRFKHLMKHIKQQRVVTYHPPKEAQSMHDYQLQQAQRLYGPEVVAQITSGDPEKGKELADQLQQKVAHLSDKMGVNKNKKSKHT